MGLSEVGNSIFNNIQDGESGEVPMALIRSKNKEWDGHRLEINDRTSAINSDCLTDLLVTFAP
jgi:hypothetical protein